MNYTTTASWVNIRANIPSQVAITWVDLGKTNINTVWVAGAEPDGFTRVYKSTNAGGAWTSVFQVLNNQNIATAWEGHDGAFWSAYTDAALGLDVADNNPNIVVRSRGHVEITTNGGTTWKTVSVLENFLNPVGQASQKTALYKTAGLEVTTSHHLFWKNAESTQKRPPRASPSIAARQSIFDR